MSLNDTPSGERIHIGFFGRRNAGKSSLVNRVTDQELAVVSDTKGTTTDPVTKAMELLPLGPVVIIDTPGFDDVGDLGAKRISKTRLILNRVDVAVLVVDITEGIGDCEKLLISLFDEKKIPYIIAYNKADLMQKIPSVRDNEIYVSSITGSNISELKEMIARSGSVKKDVAPLISDLIDPGDTVILVIPIDSSAPKGRIILPQQQVLREILDCNAKAMCVQHTELDGALSGLKGKAALVVTDSQVFGKIAPIVPADVRLTSFSILMARHKGFLSTAVRGAAALDRLKDGDTVLISEGCTHHRQCEDIGTVKLPAWIRQYTGKQLRFETTSGLSFADDLSRYSMIVHCGACMLNDREVLYRMASAEEIGIPMTNYGIAIAHMHGILARSLEVFPGLYEEFVNG